LKTRGNTPKYGLIFHSSFIGRAASKNKGRISRYLANKCTIASRIDCFSGIFSFSFLFFLVLFFSFLFFILIKFPFFLKKNKETPTHKFGDALKNQVEQRLEFYEDGKKPPRNIDVMHSVMEDLENGKIFLFYFFIYSSSSFFLKKTH